MSQTRELLITLKKALKAQGITYAQVAEHLDLTEASVKRLFSQQGFTLERLDQVCQLLDIQISDLVQLMNEQQHQLQQLSAEQEQEITCDLKLLLVSVAVLNRWRFSDIVEHYQSLRNRVHPEAGPSRPPQDYRPAAQ